MRKADTPQGGIIIFVWAMIISYGILVAIGYHTSGYPNIDNLAVGVAFFSIGRAVIAIMLMGNRR